jgi:uncharacterized protein (DUF1501 family)
VKQTAMTIDRMTTRRGLLSGAAALGGIALLPGCATDANRPETGARASALLRQPQRGTAAPGALTSRILVLVELHGGNDGLNTVVPLDQPAYRSLRPSITIDPAEAISLTAAQGLHPELRALAEPYERGELAIVNAVGYPKPNRSHFRSIEIWEQATDADSYAAQGWATRALSEHPVFGQRRGDADGVVVGTGTIGPLAGPGTRLVTMREPRQFLAQSEALRHVALRADAPPSLRHIVRTQNEAVAAADAVRRKLSGRNRFGQGFGWDPLGRSLAVTADLIADGVEVPVWKTSIGSFDTHADQRARHARLLGQLGAALATFRGAMQSLGRWNDTLVVTYSEFGRRAAENLSRGTDHGTAAPLFVMGGAVEGGIHGTAPDLEALVDGDIRMQTDFRGVYAGLIARWWDAPDNFLAREGHGPSPLTRSRMS